MSYFLRLEMKQVKERIFISQKAYAKEVLKSFKMKYCKLIGTSTICGIKLSKYDEGAIINSTLYKNLVGSLIYLTCTRLDILYRIGLISHYMQKPKSTHLKVVYLYIFK